MYSFNKTARVTGGLYLIIFSLGIFAELFVRQSLIVPGDIATTLEKITAAESLFRLALVSDLVRHVLLILLPLGLYALLKPVNQNIAVVMVVIALIGIPIALLNMLLHFAVLLLVNGAGYLTAISADQLHAQVRFLLDLHRYGEYIPQFLSLWLLPLGYLVYRSGFLPKLLGVLLVIGCLGYLTDAVSFILFNKAIEPLSFIAFLVELLFAMWLLIKGVKVSV
jgi:hypothetical protein